jgi:enoyl-CoA hydratase
MLTGRFINAERSLRVGLVSEVVPDADLTKAARAYLDDMVTTSPLGLRLTKECLNMSVDSQSLEAAIAMEDRNQILCSQTADVREGMTAFLQKRAPNYSDS